MRHFVPLLHKPYIDIHLAFNFSIQMSNHVQAPDSDRNVADVAFRSQPSPIEPKIADVVILKNLELANDDVQIQALEVTCYQNLSLSALLTQSSSSGQNVCSPIPVLSRPPKLFAWSSYSRPGVHV